MKNKPAAQTAITLIDKRFIHIPPGKLIILTEGRNHAPCRFLSTA
jgi:hypothetical protein